MNGAGAVALGGEIAATTFSGAKMVINSNGNVGIGTTIPQARLHVEGDVMLLNGVSLGGYDGGSYSRLELAVPHNGTKLWQFRSDGSIWYYNGTTWIQKVAP